MNVLNRLKIRIKDTFHLILWNVRNFYNRIKDRIKVSSFLCGKTLQLTKSELKGRNKGVKLFMIMRFNLVKKDSLMAFI